MIFLSIIYSRMTFARIGYTGNTIFGELGLTAPLYDIDSSDLLGAA